MKVSIKKFPSLLAASKDLCEFFVQNLNNKLSAAFPGGSTPEIFFSLLSKEKINWKNLYLTLTDERWVETTSKESNQNLLAKYLQLKEINFFPLKTEDKTPEIAAEKLNGAIKEFPLPFDIIVLGMGEDGHIASIFPGSVNIDKKNFSIGKANNLDRISLSLKTILNSRKIIVLVSGEKKLEIIEKILAGIIKNLPISAIINQNKVPVEIFWAEK